MMSVQQIKIDLNVSMIKLLFNRKSMIYKLLLTQVTNHKKFMKLKSWNLICLIYEMNIRIVSACLTATVIISNWTKDLMCI